MWKSLKRFLVGDPISTERAQHERLNKTALAVFSSDALSSVAYSIEAGKQKFRVVGAFSAEHPARTSPCGCKSLSIATAPEVLQRTIISKSS
jgi:hypothetical protein